MGEILRTYFGEVYKEILPSLKVVNLKKGEVLMQQGDMGHEMYIVIHGLLEAYIHKDGEHQYIGTAGKGECVGEMALIEDSIRTANVVARRASTLLQIDRSDFELHSKKHSSLPIQLNKVLARRLKEKNLNSNASRGKSKFIALKSIKPTDLEQIESAITDYWGNNRKIRFIKEADIEDHSVLSGKLIEMEDMDHVFMVCGTDEMTSRRFMDEADKVVYFCTGTDLGEKDLFSGMEVGDADELVVFFETEMPEHIRNCLDTFHPNKIFRINPHRHEHMDRMVRLICESANCLVLGGGGAHGLSILGVMKALNEKGIPIDVIGGSSVGSIFAAALAMDWEYDEFYQKIKYSLSDHNPLNDYTFPFVALLRGVKAQKMLKQHFDLPMEYTWKNMFAIASNLSTSKTELMQEGSLYRSVAASIAIPGILPPVLHNHGLLVDGGVLNNLPTDHMRRLYHGTLIAVDVVSPISRSIHHFYKVNNWQYFRNLITGSRRNYIPGSMGTILKSVVLSSIEKSEEKARQSDIFIKPRVKKGFLAWKAIKEFEEEGYRVTLPEVM